LTTGTSPRGSPWKGREVCAVAGPDALWLRASAPTRRWAVRSSPGSHSPRESASLSYSPGRLFTVSVLWLSTVSRRWEDTERFWLDRAGGIGYDGRFQDAVYRSLITLKGLTYEPSGGIVAAATTSLPETLGGSRNWDYRYCWLRDSTFTLGALVGAGLHEEARAWQQWVLRAVAGDPADAQIMYGIDGTRRLPEYELPWLPGYEGASPVRIGNDAAGQVQGDVPGEVLAAAHVGRTAGIVPMERGWELQRWLARRLQEAWKKPDNGIWESRGKRQHFVYSKVMCWVAFDYLVKGVERFGLDGPVDRWRAMRDEIHSDVPEKGYDAGRGTFTQAYGSRALDACALLIPRVGFLPYDDERVVSTVETIHNELTEDGLVLRYRTDQPDDGLAGREGSFLICSFWMVYALWGIGRHREAEELFDQLLALRNDVGLLSEEYDTRTQRLVGNFPQAFTHLALVTCALRLSDREVNSAARE
jgi:GH15 family glucan-1,4-alpha-glucosidase